MKFTSFAILAIAIVLAGCSSSTEPETKNDMPAATASAKYSEIKEVFDTNCISCHSGPDAKQGIDLSSYDGVMKGGDEGKIVEPGDPEKSKMVMALKGQGGMEQMPKLAGPLPAETIAKIEAWIKAGAKNE